MSFQHSTHRDFVRFERACNREMRRTARSPNPRVQALREALRAERSKINDAFPDSRTLADTLPAGWKALHALEKTIP